VKVALIVPGGFGGPDDDIPVLRTLAAELSKRRHEVHVFAFSSPGMEGRHDLGGADVHLLPSPVPSPAGAARLTRAAIRAGGLVRLGSRLAREVRRAASPSPFDVIHALWANEPGVFAGLLGRASGVPVVLSVGGGEAVWIPEIRYGGAGTRAGRTLGRVAFALASEITVGTAFAREFLPSRARMRARVVPLGIDTRRFDAPTARPAGPPWRLLHVAHLNRVKDHATLLRGLAGVIARMGPVSLDCVGEDTLGGEVQSQADAAGLGAHVRFHGFVPQQRLAPMYGAAHLHLVSSRYESQGVAVLEAAAAGVPTVGTAVGILPAMAPSAACCVPPGDAPALAGAVCALLSDETRRQALGAAAQAFARTYDAGWTARAFEPIYAGLAHPA
jgi:glycosyltransferase involved in cell wall biosynthesis